MAAAAVVDRFFAALSSGDLAQAGAQLDPTVIILESGGAEHSAAEYLGGHAKGDAQFLKDAHHVLNRRTARATGDVAWVASESELHVREGRQAVDDRQHRDDGAPVRQGRLEDRSYPLVVTGEDAW